MRPRAPAVTEPARESARASHSPARHRELNFGGGNGRNERLPVADTRQIRETAGRRHGFIRVALRELLVWRDAFHPRRRCWLTRTRARYVTGELVIQAGGKAHFPLSFVSENIILYKVHPEPRSFLGYECISIENDYRKPQR